MTPQEAEARAEKESLGSAAWTAWQNYALGLRLLDRGNPVGRGKISEAVASGFVPATEAEADLARFPDERLGALSASAEAADAAYARAQEEGAIRYAASESAEYDRAVEAAIATGDPNGALAAYELNVLGDKVGSAVTGATGALFSAFRTPILVVGAIAIIGIVGYAWFAKRAAA